MASCDDDEAYIHEEGVMMMMYVVDNITWKRRSRKVDNLFWGICFMRQAVAPAAHML
jgi:hypothetical protein